ncbi:MAG: HAD family hydrolase [Gammaproteobacteria bacterium]|nr:HAD family hydrolase [Gammaproteobacteria bacterium]
MQNPRARPLTDFKVLTFDCYGTLIDWETGIWDALQPLIAANARIDADRAGLLERFGRLENRLEIEMPDLAYPRILAHVHHELALESRMKSTRALDEAFGESVARWPAFADSAGALDYLETRYRLVILSNVDRAGFAASNRKLGVDFDAVYTAEDIGSYKPHPANFEYLLRRLQADFSLGRPDVLHTAQSLFHDHVPARAAGLATAWIDRQDLAGAGSWGATARVEQPPEPDFRFRSMDAMAAAVAAAFGD